VPSERHALARHTRRDDLRRITEEIPMATEMPERVEPVDGAEEVDFPWSDARTAIAALDAAADKIHDQLGHRPDMRDTLDEWEGTYRNEFDDTDARLMDHGSAAKDNLRVYAGTIVRGAESANAEQRRINEQHSEQQRQPA
jgi:hypothetical protein